MRAAPGTRRKARRSQSHRCRGEPQAQHGAEYPQDVGASSGTTEGVTSARSTGDQKKSPPQTEQAMRRGATGTVQTNKPRPCIILLSRSVQVLFQEVNIFVCCNFMHT